MFGRRKSAETRVRVPEHKKVLFVFFAVFLLYTAALFFVFGWILLNSFKTKEEYITGMWALPKSLSIKNYIESWSYEVGGTHTVSAMFQNSLMICLLMPTIGCAITSTVAYILAKYHFKGKGLVYFIHILPMMFCLAGTQGSTYRLVDSMNLIDNIWGLAIMGCGASGMNFLILYGTYKNISNTYMEAAQLDGASDVKVYLQIMLPQALGIIGTLWMFAFINTWNDYATIKLFVPSLPTIAVGLEYIRDDFTKHNDYPMYYAALVLSLLPIIVLFMCFQEQIMKLSLGGGIKG